MEWLQRAGRLPSRVRSVYTLTTPWNFGALATGTYPLAAVVNQKGVNFAEVDTANNQAALTLDVRPDLSVSPLYFWLTSTVASSVEITAAVSNFGPVPVDEAVVAVYHSADLDPASLVFSRTLTNLAANSLVYIEGSWDDAPAGQHDLYIYADPSYSLTETTRANNLASASVTVPTLCPDVVDPPGVDVLDLQAIAQHWNEARTVDNQQYDLNWDGRIDVADILIAAGRWGEICPS